MNFIIGGFRFDSGLGKVPTIMEVGTAGDGARKHDIDFWENEEHREVFFVLRERVERFF